MPNVFDVPADLLIEEIAKDFKENLKIKQPEFASFVKSGVHRERAPQNKEWWFVRCASILRRIYVKGPLGTETLRAYYGGRKARGAKPKHFRKASGKVIRSCLQELEKQDFIKKDKEKKGRIITAKGESYLNAKAKLIAGTAEQKLNEIRERKEARQRELKKKQPTAKEKKVEKEEKKGKKKKTKEETVDITAVKLKKQQQRRH